jgi:methylated-DNA-[protein]-cysteine S-methyltransferase
MKYAASTVITTWLSPLGSMLLAASNSGLTGLWFSDQRHLPSALAAWPSLQPSDISTQRGIFAKTQAQLEQYFAGRLTDFDVPLDFPQATDFQQAVWRSLLAIKPGSTQSYGAIAAALGKPAAVRAVGGAVGRNPISIIVPCHRVIGADGALTGYAGGVPRKVALLKLEGALL